MRAAGKGGDTASAARQLKLTMCKNCVRWARSRRRTPAFTESHQRASCSGKLLNRLRNEVFRCRLVSVAEIAFQACSIDHSDISPFKINDLRSGLNLIIAKSPLKS